jgi:signal peptidase II
VRKIHWSFWTVLFIILFDQALKIWVKTNMMLGQEFVIANWFRIHFTENPGMAFGMVLPGVWGKLFLSGFRLVAVIGGIWYLTRIIKEKAHWGFTLAVSMILAGAIGNMIDGTFYGVIFSDSYHGVAKVFPAEGGYSGWMQGLVVDMLWFPLFHGFFPNWLPIWGGEYFEFFRFIFNIADAAITVGVFIILIFQKQFFAHENEVAAPAATEA